MYASQYAEKYKNIVSYYNGGKDLCVKAHKKKLVTLGEIRQTGFYTCLVLYKNFTDYINDISQVNLRVKEMQYFDFKEQENKTNEKEVIIEPKSLIFNKIILPSDEEILRIFTAFRICGRRG